MSAYTHTHKTRIFADLFIIVKTRLDQKTKRKEKETKGKEKKKEKQSLPLSMRRQSIYIRLYVVYPKVTVFPVNTAKEE